MNSIEPGAIDWIGHGWMLIVAFTAAVLAVAALRKPCRRLFGAERAFQLWLLPPLVMLTIQLPHMSTAQTAMLPAIVFTITSAATALPVHVAESSGIDWRIWTVLFWLAGMAVSAILAAIAQSRYRDRLRGATKVTDLSLHWPVWRAAGTDIGPALVGAWRTRIVLPADFEHRYDATERALILAHEMMHARRRDGWWCLLAQAAAAVFWFHPLAWWLLSALRHDQELACDAAVLREHGAQRRSYANAMLKTQSAAFALPVGCPWSPSHPITERIAMLKLPTPGRMQRMLGYFAVIGIVIGASATVYAVQQSPRTYQATPEAVKEAFALFEGSKMAVEDYALHHDFRMPADNDAAGLPGDPDLMNGKFVRRVAVTHGVIAAVLRDKPGSMATAGSVRVVPHADSTRKSLVWTCESPDIPAIAQFAVGCVYRPGVASAAPAAGTADNYNLKLEIAFGGKPAQLHDSMCLKPGQYQDYALTQSNIDKPSVWHGRFTVVPAEHGQLEVQSDMSGTWLNKPVHPKIRTLPGQQGMIQLGVKHVDKNGRMTEDDTIKIDLTPSIGC